MALGHLGVVDAFGERDALLNLLRRKGIADVQNATLVEGAPFFIRQAVLEGGGAEGLHVQFSWLSLLLVLAVRARWQAAFRPRRRPANGEA